MTAISVATGRWDGGAGVWMGANGATPPARLPALQLSLLRQAARRVRPGGSAVLLSVGSTVYRATLNVELTAAARRIIRGGVIEA